MEGFKMEYLDDIELIELILLFKEYSKGNTLDEYEEALIHEGIIRLQEFLAY